MHEEERSDRRHQFDAGGRRPVCSLLKVLTPAWSSMRWAEPAGSLFGYERVRNEWKQVLLGGVVGAVGVMVVIGAIVVVSWRVVRGLR